jgi:hypothetical protein
MEIVENKKKRVANIEDETFVSYLNPTNPWNVFRRTFKCSLIDHIMSSYQNISLIKQDILTYEEIYSQLSNDLINLQAIQQRIEYSKTFKGKYYHVLGHFFSLYCIWKIFISFINIVFNRVGKGKLKYSFYENKKLFLFQVDPVTNGIELTVHYFNLQFDVKFWSQYVSFILIGIIVVTSIRGLLITLTKV